MDLVAPAEWRCVDIISDIHLHANALGTYEAWSNYMLRTDADALMILGDLFEVWIGDDVLNDTQSFEYQCTQILSAVGSRIPLYIMLGNRDFLMRESLISACNAKYLKDPSILQFGVERFLLGHGDAWCLADTRYQTFRTMVRRSDWQDDFLSKPLAERLEIARALRAQSEQKKKSSPSSYADIDQAAVLALMHNMNATHCIHGHTHQPAIHALGENKNRIVLSDWDLETTPARAEVLRLTKDSESVIKIDRLQTLR